MNRAYHEATITVLAGIPAEEAFLTARFGQTSLDSCQRVRRFLLRVTGLRDSLRVIDWRRALWKEARIVCSWASFVLGLPIWKQWELFGFAARRGAIVTVASM